MVIRARVNVLPEPVAPATRVCAPLAETGIPAAGACLLASVSPPSSIATERPRWSTPTLSWLPRHRRSPRPRRHTRSLSPPVATASASRECRPGRSATALPASRERTPWTPARSPSSGVVRSAAISARSAPACRSSPCQRRPLAAAPSAATPSVAAPPDSAVRASTTSANTPAAQIQCRCQRRIRRAASRPRSTPMTTCTVVPTSHWYRCSSGASGSGSRLRMAFGADMSPLLSLGV